jgi:hypothetical protein
MNTQIKSRILLYAMKKSGEYELVETAINEQDESVSLYKEKMAAPYTFQVKYFTVIEPNMEAIRAGIEPCITFFTGSTAIYNAVDDFNKLCYELGAIIHNKLTNPADEIEQILKD